MTVRNRLIEAKIASGMLLHYPFWEGAGALVEDVSPFKREGSITGASWVAGPMGNALDFDASGDTYVDTVSFALTSSTNALTFLGWIYCSVLATNQDFFFITSGGGVSYLELGRAANQNDLDFIIKTSSGSTQGSDATFFTGYDNIWLHFAMMFNYATRDCIFYRDGIYRTTLNTGATPWSFPSDNETKKLGKTSSALKKFDGKLSEFKIFDRILTADEVFADYYAAARQSY